MMSMAALLLAACGQSKYQYVANRSLGSFVRMPSGWEVRDVTATQGDGRVAALPSGIQSVWKLSFASNGGSEPDDQGLPAEVTGKVEVYKINDYYREQYSISALRSSQPGAMSVDPVYPPDGVGSEKVELSAYEKVPEVLAAEASAWRRALMKRSFVEERLAAAEELKRVKSDQEIALAARLKQLGLLGR